MDEQTKKAKKKKTHSDHCKRICVGCLKKGKSLRPIVKAGSLSDNGLKFRILSQFKLESEDLNYLPTVICSTCRAKVIDPTISAPDYQVKVDYKGFIDNVKKYLNQNEDCECEICELSLASLHADPSSFLLVAEKKVVQPKKADLTDYFPQKKNATKREIASSVQENVTKESLQQFIALALDNTECDSEGNAKLKRYNGPPKKVGIGKVKPSKTVITHKTLFRIKSRCDESGREIMEIAKLLNKNPNVKVEPNFQEKLTERGHACADFFQSKVLEMFVYEEKDFQLWSYTKEGNLVDKTGQLPFKNKQFNLPEEGKKDHIQEVSTNKVLCPKDKAGSEIVLNKKKLPKKVTRSSKNVPIDDQMWIRGHADINGWFSMTHQKSGKFLTSSNSDKVTVEEHHHR
jgi:hypothetical protein